VKGALGVLASLVRKEFYLIRQDRRMLAMSFITPILQVLLLGYAATTDISGSRLIVADLDRTAESRDFVRKFTSTEYFVYAWSADNFDDVDDYLMRGDAAAALLIPPRFGDNLLSGRTAPLEIVFDGTDANTASVLLGYATQIVGSYSQGIRPEIRLAGGAGLPGTITPEPRVWFNPDLRSQYFMVPGVVALVLMIITMTLTSLAIVKEKEMGTLEQLLVAPIKRYQLILGKLIPFVVLGFVSVSLILTVAKFWFGIPMRGHILTLYALSGLFILTTLGIGLFISTIAKSQQQAMLIAQFFFFMPFTFLGGFTFPIPNMPQAIQWLTYLIPLRYFMEILRGVFLKGAGFAELWFQTLMLTVIGGTIFTLSVLRFRRRLG
jgi:ABC-2 type transport system permease protein